LLIAENARTKAQLKSFYFYFAISLEPALYTPWRPRLTDTLNIRHLDKYIHFPLEIIPFRANLDGRFYDAVVLISIANEIQWEKWNVQINKRNIGRPEFHPSSVYTIAVLFFVWRFLVG